MPFAQTHCNREGSQGVNEKGAEVEDLPFNLPELCAIE